MTSPFPYYFTWSNQPQSEPFPVARAEHDEFVLPDGRRVYDFICTSFQANFGHSHPTIRRAIARQLDEMPIASPKASFALKQRVSERLLARLGLGGGKLFYTVSGSETVENALKIARQMTGRTGIAARRKSYHGASLGALSVTGDWRNTPHFTVDRETIRIPEPDEDPELTLTREVLAKHGPDRIAAVIVETISGTNGVAIPSYDWFQGLQAVCREFDLLLIIDEVLCGFGRTGPDFAFHAYDIDPDMVCLSKAISGGYVPLGALWTSPAIADYYEHEKLTCGLTNYAHPLGLAAMEGVLDILDRDDFHENKRILEHTLASAMQRLRQGPDTREIRCRGLMAAIDLKQGPAPSWDACFAAGLHLFSTPKTMIVAPPLVSSPDRLSAACQVLEDLLAVR